MAPAIRESPQAEFSHGLLDFCTLSQTPGFAGHNVRRLWADSCPPKEQSGTAGVDVKRILRAAGADAARWGKAARIETRAQLRTSSSTLTLRSF